MTTIGVLPDDVLTEIFYFCQTAPMVENKYWWALPRVAPRVWHTLVHVCQRWRYVVLASPVYLKLFLIIRTWRTAVREMLHIWPTLPLLIWLGTHCETSDTIAALEQRDRVHRLIGYVTCFEAEGFPTVMLEPFPALTRLDLRSAFSRPMVLPDRFLGGSAPRLQYLRLECLPFPTLPKLLLSTSDLVQLHLLQLPTYGCISLDAMATSLSALTRLQCLSIAFQRWGIQPPQGTRHPPPQTHAVLPSLTDFRFEGVSEYLDDLVALIDAPHLQSVNIEFFDRLNFQIGQLSRLISHAGMLRSFGHAEVLFTRLSVHTRLYSRGAEDLCQYLKLQFQEDELSLQVLTLVQMYSRLSSLLSSVEQLDILNKRDFGASQVNIDNTHWLELFQPFTAVRTLRASRHWQSFIMPALQELTGETATAVLPALNHIYLEAYQPYGPEQQGVEHFITARQDSGHPVAIQCLESPLDLGHEDLFHEDLELWQED
jgi:hypothetical protein